MQSNMQVESTSNGGSEQGGSSDNGQNLVALVDAMKPEDEEMVIHYLQQLIGNGGSEQGHSSDDGRIRIALRQMIEKEIKVMLMNGRMFEKEINVMLINALRQEIVSIVKDSLCKVMEGGKNGGSKEAISSDDGQFPVALIRQMIKKETKVMVINTVRQEIVPNVEDLFRNIVKNEIQSALKKLLAGGTRNYANEMTMSKERSLQLKFLGEVCGPALTGKVLKGKEGNSIRVALVDKTTGEFVKCGPESSAKVEILLLDASGDEQNWTLEDFNNRIIKEGDKKKPHFAKSVCINLKEGIGNLDNAKLGHGANWVKSCNCRLGARIVQTVTGIEVQEAWTESFMVSDSRGELYKKHYPPSLSSEVWRLDNITRDGAPCKHLNEEKVETVRDFLFLHSVNPGRLEQIVRNGTKIWKPAMWKVTVDHAKTCKIGEERMYYPSTESKMGVMFDAIGGLKGVIQESHYVQIENLSADEKDSALKLLLSVFENQKKIIPFKDEASFLQRFPCRSSDINVSTHSSTEAGSNGSDPNISENVGELHPTELGTSFQSISSYTRTSDHSNLINHCGSLGSTDMGHLYGANLSVPVQFASQFSAPENIDGRAPIDPDASSQGISPYTRTSDHLDHISHFGSLGSAGQLYECTSMDMPPQLPSWQFLGLENITGCASTFPGTSSQGISQYNRTSDHPNHINNFGSLESIGTGQLYESTSMDMGAQLPSLQFHDLENINGYPPIGAGVLSQTIIPSVRALNLPNDSFHFGSPAMGQLSEPHLGIQIPTCQSSYPDSILEQFSDDGTQTCVIISEINKPSKTQAESLSHQQSNSQASCLFGLVVNVVNAKIWLVRAKKKVMQGIHVQKKQRVQPVA